MSIMILFYGCSEEEGGLQIRSVDERNEAEDSCMDGGG